MTRPDHEYARQEDPEAPPERLCAHGACSQTARFRAPRSRDPADGHVWFCLEHIREYNRTWDYFAGMSQGQIETLQKDAVTGHRPTWRLGQGPDIAAEMAAFFAKTENRETILDPERDGEPARPVDPKERQALQTLGLDAGASLQEIRSRYKQLVKRLHPDANGGDVRALGRLKQVIQAHEFLLTCGYA